MYRRRPGVYSNMPNRSVRGKYGVRYPIYGRRRPAYTLRSRSAYKYVPNLYQTLTYKKSILTKTYSYKRMDQNVALIASNENWPKFFSTTFKLADVPNYLDWTQLYDQYKISMVVIRFLPPYDLPLTQMKNPPGPDEWPRLLLHTAVDLDSDLPPTSTDALREYQTYQVSDLHRAPVVIKFKPKVKTTMYDASSSTFSYGTDFTRDAWVDCSNPDVQHFGLKYCVDAWSDSGSYGGLNSTGHNVAVPYFVTYYISFRNTA